MLGSGKESYDNGVKRGVVHGLFTTWATGLTPFNGLRVSVFSALRMDRVATLCPPRISLLYCVRLSTADRTTRLLSFRR